ncbi:MAG: glycerophosphodiester phosphodiesterase [Legionella sp.]|nr:MAG: glycerophosphodiester phosphodiesterase [Legionella sp.]
MLLTYIEKLVNQCFAVVPRRKPSSIQAQKTRLIAHRGAHDNAQKRFENTHAAFQLAQEVGCWGIEFDIQTTKDGVLMVNHDPTLHRLWGHPVAIADLNFNELRKLEPGIPSLAEVIEQYSTHMHLFIELKAPFNHVQALLQILKTIEPIKDYHLLGLEPDILKKLSQFPKEALLLVSGHNNNQAYCNLSLKQPYGGVLGSYLLMTNKQIAKFKAAGQVYGVGFVDSKFSLYRELNRGIEWVFTNQASRISDYLKALDYL